MTGKPEPEIPRLSLNIPLGPQLQRFLQVHSRCFLRYVAGAKLSFHQDKDKGASINKLEYFSHSGKVMYKIAKKALPSGFW
jgi:hypothetical protein